MRLFLLCQGHTLEYIEKIPVAMIRKVAIMMSEGIVGNLADRMDSYNQVSTLITIRDLLVHFMSSKKGRLPAQKTFRDMQPLWHYAMTGEVPDYLAGEDTLKSERHAEAMDRRLKGMMDRWRK